MQLTRIAATPQQVRQGDVLVTPAIKPINPADIGELIKEGDGNRVVLAYGEVTGHAHAFYPALDIRDSADHVEPASVKGMKRQPTLGGTTLGNAIAPVSLYTLKNPQQYSGSTLPAESQRLLRLAERALLRHEEHSFISLPAGDYVVIQQHEGDEREELRRVAD